MPAVDQSIVYFLPLTGFSAQGSVVSAPMTAGWTGYSIHAGWELEPYPDAANLEWAEVAPQVVYNGGIRTFDEMFTRWSWYTLFCNNDVSSGAQLVVSTQFSRFLDFPTLVVNAQNAALVPYISRTIECWIKYRVSDPATLSSILLTLSGDGTQNYQYPRDYIGDNQTISGVWRVAYISKTFLASDDDGANWSNHNLRFNAVFRGLTTRGSNPTQLQTSVDAEWIAVRLSSFGLSTFVNEPLGLYR